MSSPVENLTIEDYDEAAREYAQTLTWEDEMESTSQSTQRDITSVAMAQLRQRRGDVVCFGDLLIQWRRADGFGRVVPDNLIVLSDEAPIRHRLSFAWEIELERGAQPLMAMEYVSTDDRKDYQESFRKYEQELEIPYYLVFDPHRQRLDGYHLEDGRYRPVERNVQGRFELPELELEMSLLHTWLRFWHQGELLMTSPEQTDQILKQSDQLRRQEEFLRKLVRDQAKGKQRDDILAALDEAGSDQLMQWLTELQTPSANDESSH